MSSVTGYLEIESPIGELLAIGGDAGLRRLLLNGEGSFDWRKTRLREDRQGLAVVAAQLGEYFAGEREEFELQLDPHGTEFQLAVWQALREIPYGQTRSYGQIAAAVGRPKAARAVGGANNRNPIAVIVPCHRVIGAGGSMVGYAGGLGRKSWLLDHEGELARSANSSS